MPRRIIGACCLFLVPIGCASEPPSDPRRATTSAPAASDVPIKDGADPTDATTQAVVAEELARLVHDHAAAAAVIVVLDPASGRVVASAGWTASPAPALDPTLPRTHAWLPGSTLKPFAIAAALEAGVVTPDTRLDCAERSYPEGVLRDYAPLGELSVREVLARSSNVGVSRVLDALGTPRLAAAYARFHLVAPTTDRPAWGDAQGLEAATFAIGQRTSTTPLQVAAAYAALVNHGVYHAPSDDGRSAPERVVTAEAADATLDLLEGAVGGPPATTPPTGHNAALPGHRVAGKTGTAELAAGRVYASFVGTVRDAQAPRVILVGLDAPTGTTGGGAAAPVFARIAARVMAP